MEKTDQLGQVRKKRDLLSLSLVSKAVHEVLLQAYLWRSVSIEICEGSLDSFPSFVPNSGFLNYTRDVHFSSEFVRNLEERCPHFHQHGKDSGEGDIDQGEDDNGRVKTTWEVAPTGVSIPWRRGQHPCLTSYSPGHFAA